MDLTPEIFQQDEAGHYVIASIPEHWRPIFEEHQRYNSSRGDDMDPFQVTNDDVNISRGFRTCFPVLVDFGDNDYSFYHIYPYTSESEMNSIVSRAKGRSTTVYILKPTKFLNPEKGRQVEFDFLEDYLKRPLASILSCSVIQKPPPNIDVLHLDRGLHFNPFNDTTTGYNVVLGKGLITFWDQSSKDCLSVFTLESLVGKDKNRFRFLSVDDLKEWVYDGVSY